MILRLRGMVGNKILDRLALVYVTLAPVAFVLVFLAALSQEVVAILAIAIYALYGISSAIIAVGCVMLCRRREGDFVPAWLVSLTYEAIFFSFTLWGVFALVILRTLYPALVLEGVEAPSYAQLLRGFSYAIIGSSATGTAISAWVMSYGLLRGGLFRMVRPWPWRSRRHPRKLVKGE